MKKLITLVFSALISLLCASTALAEVVYANPFNLNEDGNVLVIVLAAVIALIALAVLVYLVLQARRRQ